MTFDPSRAVPVTLFDSALAAEGITGKLAEVARSIYQQESGGGRNTKTSNAGAVGHMQVIPETFSRMADQGWNIANPEHNIRAGLRYIKQLAPLADNEPKLIAAGYYGGEGAIPKAKAGIAIGDPRNPNAPNTLQYGEQVAGRVFDPSRAVPVFDPSRAVPIGQQDAPQQPNRQKFVPEPSIETPAEAIAGNPITRFALGAASPVLGAAQLMANASPVFRMGGLHTKINDHLANLEKTKQAGMDANGGGFDWAGLLGGILNPVGLAAGGAVTAAPTALRSMAQAGALGAGMGATTPVTQGDFVNEKAKQIAIGGAAGAAGDRVAAGLARLIQPVTRTPQIQTLLDNGIVPTVGQAAGPQSFAGRVEQKLQSFPIIGDVIQNSRQRADTTELQRAAFARATPRGVQPTQLLGRDGVDDTYQRISQVYQQALDNIGQVRLDNNLLTSIEPRMRAAAPAMTAEQLREVGEVVRNTISQGRRPVAGTTMTAEQAKGIDQTFGQVIRAVRSSQNSPPMAAEALQAAQQSWRDLIRRNAPNTQTADMLDDANRAFANYIRVERASSRNLGDGSFNATDLSRAVRDATQGRKAAFARGDALMQDLSDPAATLMAKTVANSATTDRALLAGMVSNPLKALGAAAGGMAAAPLYSRMGSRYMLGDLIPGQQALSQGIRNVAPYAAPTSAVTLLDLLKQGQQ